MDPHALPLTYADGPLDPLGPDLCSWLDDAPAGWTDEPHGLPAAIPTGPAEALSPSGWAIGSDIGRLAGTAALVPMLMAAPVVEAAPAPELVAPVVEPASPASSPVADAATIWDTLVDREVLLGIRDGPEFRGTVLGVVDGKLVCAQTTAEAGNGIVVHIDPAKVTTIQVLGLDDSGPPRPPQTGEGAIVFGAIATSIGSALALATIGVFSDCMVEFGDICGYYTIPLGVASVVNLGFGIPILTSGVHKRKRYRAAQASHAELSAFVNAGGDGLMLGLGGRF